MQPSIDLNKGRVFSLYRYFCIHYTSCYSEHLKKKDKLYNNHHLSLYLKSGARRKPQEPYFVYNKLDELCLPTQMRLLAIRSWRTP